MHANEYQRLAARTLIAEPENELTGPESMVVWNALGLAGEAGEVADLIKKGVFHQHGVSRDTIRDELGDVLWYVAALCTNHGLTLEEVMEANVEKLKQRYPEGYSSERSINREKQ
ncbi:MAG: nucleoside triphosphate pyrophosphohydrolase family protein [Bacteroidota bacterium]